MNPDDKRRMAVLITLLFPVMIWLIAVHKTEKLWSPKYLALLDLLIQTPRKPVLLAAYLGGLIISFFFIWLLFQTGKGKFGGAPFQNFLRGTRMVTAETLKRKTAEKKTQVSVAGVPFPRKIETLHLLLNGATGTGKSVLLRELVYSVMLRGDRMIIIDPNADMYSKFSREKDILLNPYDKRTKGWSFFNEVRSDYDFHRYALSLVPRGRNAEAEEWASYGRLLLRETARKLERMGEPSIRALYQWTTIKAPKELYDFLKGTLAESLFAGSSEATRALSSARFVLSDKLPEHVSMPAGDFSIRRWLENSEGRNLYITWREDMGPSLKPLISAWVDVICTSVLSMEEKEENCKTWLVIDELASLEKLASLQDALTKGRKHGLRVVAGLQSTSQLEEIYGWREAQTIRSCFRSLVVLGGSRTDPKTNEDMSLSLGEHEVERARYSKSIGRSHTITHSLEPVRERVVSPAEISSMPELTAYVAFAGNFPIAKVRLEIKRFVHRSSAFQEVSSHAQ